jgi:general secretion pathway protein G
MMSIRNILVLAWMERNTKIGKRVMKRMTYRNRGFTLLEIMIVFALIGILVGLGLPQYKTATKKAREAVLKENLFQIRKLIDQYYADKGKYPTSLQTLVDEDYVRYIPIDPITKSSGTWVEIQEIPSDDELLLDFQPGVVDVRSGSDQKALDGTLFNTW